MNKSLRTVLIFCVVGPVLLLANRSPAGARAAAEPTGPDVILSGHRDTVVSMAVFSDGSRAVSASRDRTAKLWDLNSGELMRTFAGHLGPVQAVAVSPDGKWIATGSTDRTARIWNADNGDQVALFEGHTSSVNCVRFLHDGRLVTAGFDSVRVWDIAGEKVLWRVPTRFRIDAADISADGRRVAFTEDDTVTRVWDVDARRRLGEFGSSRLRPLHIWISPDGKQVIYATGQTITYSRWDVDANKPLELGVPLGMYATCAAFTPDARRLILRSGHGVEVYDLKTSQPRQYLQTTVAEATQSIAVSADGRTILLGSGGEQQPGGRWQTGRVNKISVFHPPDPDAAAAQGSPAGLLSWEVIPAHVRLKSGRQIQFNQQAYAQQLSYLQEGPLRKLFDDLDGVCVQNAVLFHREKGILDEVLTQQGAGFADLVSDGRDIWVRSTQQGVWVLDRSGKLLARAGEAEGLPSNEVRSIFAMGTGRVLVTGVQNGTPAHRDQTGWVAALDYDAARADRPVSVNVVASAAKMPEGWDPGDVPRRPVFEPKFTAAPINDSIDPKDRVILIPCGATRQSAQPILRVRPDGSAVSLYNLNPPGESVPNRFMYNAGPFARPTFAYRLDDGSLLCLDMTCVRRVTLGPQRLDLSGARRLVCDIVNDIEGQDWLYSGGRLFVPGPTWYRIDPAKLQAVRIGPGLRVDGKLVRDKIRYAVSAHFGLCGLSSTDGCFYRFSVDPNHPAPIHATLDHAPKDLPDPQGTIRPGPGLAELRCGYGSASAFLQNDRVALAPPRDAELDDAAAIRRRLTTFPDERDRVGLTAAQVARIDQLSDAFYRGQPDAHELEPLWKEYAHHTDGPERQRAARALLDRLRAIGDRRHSAEEQFLHDFRQVFTDRQWKMLHYEPTTAPSSQPADAQHQ